VAEMEKVFFDNPVEKMWSFWPTYIIEPFYKKSFTDFSALGELVKNILHKRPWIRKISIQSVDLITGKVVIFDETVSESERDKAVLSSTSIPSIF